LGSFSPVEGVQEHIEAPEPESSADDPMQIVVEPDATATGGDATMTVSSFEVIGLPNSGVVVSTR
jgi:hypothetical protein